AAAETLVDVLQVGGEDAVASERLALPFLFVRVIRVAAEDFGLQIWRIGEVKLDAGGVKAADHEPVDLPRWVGHGQIDRSDAEAALAEQFPDRAAVNLDIVVEREPAGGVVVAQKVDHAVAARTLAGHEGGPCGGRDGGLGGFENTARAAGN